MIIDVALARNKDLVQNYMNNAAEIGFVGRNTCWNYFDFEMNFGYNCKIDYTDSCNSFDF